MTAEGGPRQSVWQRVTRIWKFFWGVVRGYLMMVGLMVTVLPLLLMFALRFSDGRTTVSKTSLPKDGFALHLHFDGQIVPVNQRSTFSFFSGLWRTGEDLALDEWQRTMRSLGSDERVKAVYISIHQLKGEWTDFAEARRAVVALREKRPNLPIVFHLMSAGNSDYYFASAGTSIAVTPAGDLSIPGPIFTLAYFREALANLGVQFEVMQFGKYKSAMEPFSEDKPTPSSLAMFSDLEKSLRAHLVATVAGARQKEIPIVDGWFRQGIFSGKQALEGGLIDVLAYEDELRASLLGEAAVEEWVDGGDYVAETGTLLKDREHSGSEGIGIIYAHGEIHLSRANDPQGETITPASMREQVEYMLEEDDVKAVVLRVDSPGGSALASDMIWRDIRRLADVKPVVTSMGSVAASGGYYIAAPAAHILAESPTITGSIGVIAAIPNFAVGEAKFGVNFETVTQSDRARMYDPGSPMGPFDRAILESQIKGIYEMFLERVAEGRKMEVAAVHEHAQGRVFTGAEAKEVGLVDAIGGLSDAFRLAKEMGKLDPEKLYRVYEYKGKDLSFFQCLSDRKSPLKCLDYLGVNLNLNVTSLAPLPAEGSLAIAHLNRVRRMLERERVLTWLPAYRLH